MEVKKPGRNDPAWKREFECPGCGAVMEVTRDDIFTEFEHDIGGQRHEVKFVCDCQNEVVIGNNAKLGFRGLRHREWSKATSGHVFVPDPGPLKTGAGW